MNRQVRPIVAELGTSQGASQYPTGKRFPPKSHPPNRNDYDPAHDNHGAHVKPATRAQINDSYLRTVTTVKCALNLGILIEFGQAPDCVTPPNY